MQISKISFSYPQNGLNIQQTPSRKVSFTSKPMSDTFTKSVSFGEVKNPKLEKALDILATGGVIGVPLLLSLAGGIWLAKDDDPSIYLRNNRYVFDPEEESIKSDHITIDPHNGIYKIDGTNIDINPEKYDYVNVEKGIFRNYDGSVDIDLSNNKFIDKVNGIFVDPDAKISAIQDGDSIKDIIIPSFKGAAGPNMGPIMGPTVEEMRSGNGALTRSEYIRRFGVKPEDSEYADSIERGGWILHDKESFWDRMKDFFTGDNGNRYDIFGRKIYSYTTPDGHEIDFPMDEETARLVENNALRVEKVPELIKAISEYKNQLFIRTVDKTSFNDMDDFMHRNSDEAVDSLAEHAQNVIEQAQEAIPASAPPGVWEEIHEQLANILSGGIG